jgi:hypothetical protein
MWHILSVTLFFFILWKQKELQNLNVQMATMAEIISSNSNMWINMDLNWKSGSTYLK